jgi:hypothetical protein
MKSRKERKGKERRGEVRKREDRNEGRSKSKIRKANRRRKIDAKIGR